jgi:hypothetical protein
MRVRQSITSLRPSGTGYRTMTVCSTPERMTSVARNGTIVEQAEPEDAARGPVFALHVRDRNTPKGGPG